MRSETQSSRGTRVAEYPTEASWSGKGGATKEDSLIGRCGGPRTCRTPAHSRRLTAHSCGDSQRSAPPSSPASPAQCRTFISQTKVASSRQYVLAIPPRQTCKHTLSVKKLVNRKRQRTRTRACCTLRHVRVSCKQRCWRGTHLRGNMRCSILTGRQITLAVRSRTWGRFGMLLLPDSLFSTSDRSLAGMRYVWL